MLKNIYNCQTEVQNWERRRHQKMVEGEEGEYNKNTKREYKSRHGTNQIKSKCVCVCV